MRAQRPSRLWYLITALVVAWALGATALLQLPRIPSLPRYMFLYDGGNLLQVHGTWVLEGDEIGFPMNALLIECFKPTGICSEASFRLVDDSYFMNVTLDEMKIERWTDEEIVFRDKSAKCRENLVRIDLVKKTVRSVSVKKNETGCADLSNENRIAVLEDGRLVTRKLKMRAAPWWIKLLADE